MSKKDDFENEWSKILDKIGAEGQEMEAAVNWGQLRDIMRDMMAGGFSREDSLRIIAYGMFHQPDKEEGST